MTSGQSVDFTLVRIVVDVVQIIIVFVLGLYLYVTRNSAATRKETDAKIKGVCDDLKSTDERVEKHAARFERHAERLSTLEEHARSAPSHDDLANLHSRINDVAGAVKEVGGTLKGLSNTVDLIHKFLLENGKAKES